MPKTYCVLGLLIGITAASSLSLAGVSTSGGNGSRAQACHTDPPKFTLDQAIQTALRQNPTLLNAIQEIERTKGVIIEIRAQAWHIYS